MTEDIKKTVLPNGVRVVSEHVGYVQSVSVGIWVAAGSRYEDDSHRGISHFLEHMLFKGTEKRPSAKQIADEMDAVGGYLNAFTDKEYTCYYARALSEHLPLAVDILTDMYAHSLFDPEETARERKVVLEEIKRREDDPDDLVHDLFAETIFPDHALGKSVIGLSEVVAALTPEELRSYMGKYYGPESVIVSVSGNMEHEKVVDLVGTTLGDLKGGSPTPNTIRPPITAKTLHYPRPTEQVNFCIGTKGYGQFDDDRYALALMDAVLGGSMGSRLFQEIREKRGLAYSVGSYSATHREGGYFVAYGGTSPDTYEQCLELARIEFEKVRKDGVTEAELNRAKNQFRGALIMAQESMSSRMNRMGKSEVYFDRVVPMDEVTALIDKVTLDDIRRVADGIFPADPAEYAIAAVGPFNGVTAADDEEAEDAEDAETEAA